MFGKVGGRFGDRHLGHFGYLSIQVPILVNCYCQGAREGNQKKAG